MPAEPADLGPLVDHHCHGLVLDDLDRPTFEGLMNEAAAPRGATALRSAMVSATPSS